MVEALKVRSIAYKQRWGEAAEPMRLIERSKILVENLQIRDVIKQLDDDARGSVRERLNALYADHIERGLIRSGATLRDGIVVFEEEAGSLIDNLLLEVLRLSRSAGAFALVLEGVEQFLALLDGELARIVKKVEYENQETGSSHGIARAAQNLWAEKRSGLLEGLERHRWEFLVPAQDIPDADLPPTEADDDVAEAPVVEAADDPDIAEDMEEPPIVEETEASAVDQDDAPPAEVEAEEPAIEHCIAPEATRDDRAPALAGHWHEMWAETAMKLWAGKLRPKSRADLARAMADWFERQGLRPAEDETVECARRLWTKFAATQRVTSIIANNAREQSCDLTASGFDLLGDRAGAGAYRVSSLVDPEQSDASRAEPAAVLGPDACRPIDLTAPSLEFD